MSKKIVDSILISTSLVLLAMFVAACIPQIFSYQIAARELSHVVAIQSMRDGTFQAAGNFPENIYLYGPLKAYLIAFLPSWGGDVIMNRVFSLVCLLGACVFLGGAVRRLGRIAVGDISWSVTIFISLLYLFTVGKSFEMPNTLGLMISNAVLFFSLKDRHYNLLLLPILIAACFCTKQYFLHSLVYVAAAYVVLRPSRKSFIQLVAISLASAVLLALLFLLPQTCYALHHHLNMRVTHTKMHLLQGAWAYVQVIWPILVCIVPLLAVSTVRISRTWQGFRQFLFGRRCRLYFICLFVVYGSVMLRLGQHTGAPGEYYFQQIFSPLIFFFAAYLLRAPGKWSQFGATAAAVAAMAACVCSRGAVFHVPNELTEEAGVIAADFRNPDIKVRGSAFTSRIQYEIMGRVDENGHIQYLDTIYPSQGYEPDSCYGVAAAYKEKLRSDIVSGYWDVLYVDGVSYISAFSEEIEVAYREDRTIQVLTWPKSYTVTRYVRK